MNQAPPVPADCDLRDFPYLPLHVVRLRDSGLTATATGDEFRAAVLLWCAAWHQVPAGSLPDDDRAISHLAGYGRDVRGWKKVRDGALHGWLRASDNRLYHPTLAEQAVEAWRAKQSQRARTSAATLARRAHGQRDDDVTGNVTKVVTSTVTLSKGREGKGTEGKGVGETPTPPPIDPAQQDITSGPPAAPRTGKPLLGILELNTIPGLNAPARDRDKLLAVLNEVGMAAMQAAVRASLAEHGTAWENQVTPIAYKIHQQASRPVQPKIEALPDDLNDLPDGHPLKPQARKAIAS